MRRITQTKKQGRGTFCSHGRQVSYDKEKSEKKPLLKTDALGQSARNDSATHFTPMMDNDDSTRDGALSVESPNGRPTAHGNICAENRRFHLSDRQEEDAVRSIGRMRRVRGTHPYRGILRASQHKERGTCRGKTATLGLKNGENVGNIPLHPTVNAGYHHAHTSYVPPVSSGMQVRGDEGHGVLHFGDRHRAQSPLHAFTNVPPVSSGMQVRGDQGQRPVLAYTNGHHVSDAVSGANNSTSDDDFGERCYSNSPRNPGMAVESDRLATFDGWPAQMKQKPKELAQAGLYYTGDGDKVKCFHCDVLLYNWDPEDDPFVKHARWFPDCEYIRLVKGEDFVRDVKNGKNVHDHVMQTPAMLAVLFDGHTVDTVQKALDAMKAKDGPNEVISAERLLNTVLEIEEAENGTVRHVNGVGVPEDVTKLRNEYEDLREKQQCKICMDKDIEVIFYPCKHIVCCASCGMSVPICPICRERVRAVDKVYMS